ncbi:RagB/SusD family nutrient uptake outer membrane protein [Solitalea canadensis]|uniref:RagB/SusD family protein n=1 Tax=Solitalea canadensis (strain ATCC 29591 / DSM 3403 / JCM 21819 / LMG 8368 / NBRC 15130 / NCIMB 12057 / USAM 9D) TaxID=929556 RepID=H8KT86_SOLCM|nr:RagB/SusD family nutrient uptake outer membrane protein [Solitalea canadensis]AFD05269.1 RagB/SusD family protein [Solitalea canadensis DSM 3403]
MNLFNKTYKRNSAVFLMVAFVSLLGACSSDFLDRVPQGSYTSGNFPYPNGGGPYDQYINSAYGSLREWNISVFPFMAAVSVRSDDADKGSTPADGPSVLQMDNFTILPSNDLANGLWVGHYNVINNCNIVLNQISTDENKEVASAVKLQAEAEARFLRGYAYFMMVRLFGRVPIIDKVSSGGSANNIQQSEPAAIYALIESDLQFAAANLPFSWDAKFIGRATRGAANGLLAKVYLTQKKWAPAMNTAEIVINSNQYDLSTPYDKIFSESGENSRESVFEIQATANPTNPTIYGVQYANVQGVRGTGSWDLGWGFNVPSTNLEAAYEANDPRKERTILYSGGTSVYGEQVPSGLPNPRYNHKVYSNPSIRAAIGNRFGWWMNVRVLRFADVVLMYAEAANELGKTTEALEKLEMVRARARNGNNGILPQVTTTDQMELRTAIRQERRVELGMEHDRFFDLVRWGIAASTLQAAGKNFNNNRDNLLPIPQTQIDISKGVLTQNPGY